MIDEDKDREAWSEFVTILIEAAAAVAICAVLGLMMGLLYGVMK